MILLLLAGLTLGLGTIALLGLLAIGRGLFRESIIDAPSMPDASSAPDASSMPDASSALDARARREQAYRSPSVYSSAIPTD
jgi:hypothetical protein